MLVKNVDNKKQSFGIKSIIPSKEFIEKAAKLGIYEQIGDVFLRIKDEYPQYKDLSIYLENTFVYAKKESSKADIGALGAPYLTQFTPGGIYNQIKLLLDKINKAEKYNKYIDSLNKKYKVQLDGKINLFYVNMPNMDPKKLQGYFSTAAIVLSDMNVNNKFILKLDTNIEQDYPVLFLINKKRQSVPFKDLRTFDYYFRLSKHKSLKRFSTEADFERWLVKSIKKLEKKDIKVEKHIQKKLKRRALINRLKGNSEENIQNAAEFFESLKPELKAKVDISQQRFDKYGKPLINAGIPEHNAGELLAYTEGKDVPEIVEGISTSTDEKINNL